MNIQRTQLAYPAPNAAEQYKKRKLKASMSTLVRKHANKNRLGTIHWGPKDFDVLNTDRCIGRAARAPVVLDNHCTLNGTGNIGIHAAAYIRGFQCAVARHLGAA